MCNDQPDRELVKVTYQQLMEHIRKQDDRAHSWTKFYLSIQAALAVALSFLMTLSSSQDLLVSVGSVFIPFLGIATAVCLTNIICREMMWQGRYISQIRKLTVLPETYRKGWVPEDPGPEKRGYIAQQFWWLRIILIVGWSIWAMISLLDVVGLLKCLGL